ncbi:MAG: hypothetical protein Q7S53_03670 [bacterium]|nr:hypothetical protein [bacterium]
MKKPICILTAGPPGASKTPVAYYLSWNLGLGMFSTDAIRLEVLEDILENDLENEQINQRIDERLEKLINSKRSFIYDASIDRKWPKIKKQLEDNGYRYFIISFDLNPELLEKMAKAKRYGSGQELVDRWYNDHQNFLEEYGQEVALSIKNNNFSNRLDISLKAVEKFLKESL